MIIAYMYKYSTSTCSLSCKHTFALCSARIRARCGRPAGRPADVIAERLSARHLILLHSQIAFVYMYVCPSHFNAWAVYVLCGVCGLDIHS